MTEQPIVDTPSLSIAAMVEMASKRVYALKAEQSKLRENRAKMNERIKAIDVEVDQAQRVARALTPRRRGGTS